MTFKDYSANRSSNTTIGGDTFVGPNMPRNNVRPAIQQIMADGRELYDEMIARNGGSDLPNFIASGAGAVTRTVQAKLREIVSLEDYGGGTSKTAAENKTALERVQTAFPDGVDIMLQGGTYEMAAGASISTAGIRLVAALLATIHFPVLGAEVTGLEITASTFAATNVDFSGPGTATVATSDEKVVAAYGASTSARIERLRFDNCEFRNSGFYGLWVRFANQVTLNECRASDVAYGSWFLLSCDDVSIDGGRIYCLNAVGQSANAYGVSFTSLQVGYNLDPNKGLPTAANPFCNKVRIRGLTVVGPAIWQAIDTHGVYNFSAVDCHVFAAKHGIAAQNSSGDASAYAGWSCSIANCVVDLRLEDGSVSGTVPGYGYTVTGGSAQPNSLITFSGNKAIGYGSASGGCSVNMSAYVERFAAFGNILDNWNYVGILCTTNVTHGAFVGTVFGSNGANAECFNITGGTANSLLIDDTIITGTPSIGIRFDTGSAAKVGVGKGNWQNCTIPFLNPEGAAHGEGCPGLVNKAGVSGAVTIDLAFTKSAPGIPATVRFQNLTGAVTSIAFTGMTAWQQVVILNEDSGGNSVTYTRSAARLDGTVDQVLARYQSIIIQYAPNGEWRQIGKKTSNG